jgi:hypothetical protein
METHTVPTFDLVKDVVIDLKDLDSQRLLPVYTNGIR